jgi:hypothetical protein
MYDCRWITANDARERMADNLGGDSGAEDAERA